LLRRPFVSNTVGAKPSETRWSELYCAGKLKNCCPKIICSL